jgi:hypothetical protein
VRFVRRPGLGFGVSVDPTAGLPGGGPISVQFYPCPIRYLADGTAQTSEVPPRLPGGPTTGVCNDPRSPSAWTNIDMSKPFNGLKRYLDGIEMVWMSTAAGGLSGTVIGWNVTHDGIQEYTKRVTAKATESPIYAPLPPGIDGTVKRIPTETINDKVTLDYAIALDAATEKSPDSKWVYYDPVDWSGYTVLPDGFLAPEDGGTAVFASDDTLDGIQKQVGVAGNQWYWIIYTHPQTGQQKAYLTQHIKSKENIFTKMGKIGPLVISIVGTVLSPFTLGASEAVAAILDTTIALEQKKAAAAAAKAQGQHNAAVLQAQVDYQTTQVNQQADAVYQQNQTAFLAAGYTPTVWAGLTLDQKTALIQQAAAGQLQPTPAALAVIQQTAQAASQAVQSASAQAATGATVPSPGPSSGMLLLLGAGGVAALAMAQGKK